MELLLPSRSRKGMRFAQQRDGALSLKISKGAVFKDVCRINLEERTPSLSIVLMGKAKAAIVLMLPTEKLSAFTLDIRLNESASLSLLCIESRRAGSMNMSQNISLKSGSSLHLFNMAFGDRGERMLVSQVEGRNARSAIDWLFCASDRAELKLSARNIFRAKGGSGDITMKGIAEDFARVDCRGAIEIGKGGGGTASSLTQNILMLDAHAKVTAVPALEIQTDDVKASHATAITKISEEDLFYVVSRGIPKEEARAMYVRGFLGDMLARIENAEMRALAEEALEKKLISLG